MNPTRSTLCTPRPLGFTRALAACAALAAPFGCDETPMASDAGALADASGSDGGPIEIGDPLTWDHREAGPFRVGYRTWQRTYTPAGRTEPRTIRIHVWYPTLATRGAAPMYGGLVLDRRALTDAAPAAPAHASGRYPVSVYSHGFRGFGGTAHFLHRHLASHGWLVVAPDHTGNTLADHMDPLPTWHYYVRSLDTREALDAIDELDAADPLAGLADTSRVLMSGHSFGTHTAWASAGATFDVAAVELRCTAETPCTDEERAVFATGVRDARVVAAIPMAGAIRDEWFGAEGHTSVTIPLFSMTGGADTVDGMGQFTRVAGLDFLWADVADACHEFFGLGCADPSGTQESIVGALALAFGRRHVLADEGAMTLGLLDATIEVPRVTLMRR